MADRPLHDRDESRLRADLDHLATNRRLQRRQALNWLLSGSAAALVSACGGGSGGGSGASTTGSATSTTTGTA